MTRPLRRLLRGALLSRSGMRPPCFSLPFSTTSDQLAAAAAATAPAKSDKPPMPLRESLSIDDSSSGGVLVSAAIVGTLGLGFYLHQHDYMHRREAVGVLEAAPGPLKPLVGWVQRNVPGAYDTRQGGPAET